MVICSCYNSDRDCDIKVHCDNEVAIAIAIEKSIYITIYSSDDSDSNSDR